MDRLMNDVKGKIIAITGGAGGLGSAMLNSFLKYGAKLAIALDINETYGQNAVAALRHEYGDRAVFYKCDILTDLDAVYEIIIKNHQKVDILINSAGISDEKSVRNTIETNTIALMEWSIKFYDHMRKDNRGDGGTIINISSILGYRVLPYSPFYQASKFAVIGFSKSLGHESNFKKTGVRTVTLCPGCTRTKLNAKPHVRDDEMLPQLLSEISGFEWQDPENVGEGAVETFIKAVSGTVWVVEGSRPAEKLDI